MTPDQPPPDDDEDVGVPPLNTFEEKLLAIGIGGALGVGGIGLYSSYDAVGKAADGWGFDPYWILPVGIDVAIPVFSLAHLLLIRLDMSLAWVRAVPWALTFVSMYLNITAADDNLPAQIGHGALPLLWVGCSEIAAHIYRNMIGAATGRRMERVRRARWILAPLSTARLWRRMVLTEVTSYRVGLKLERNRKMVRAEFQDRLGKGWRKKITKQERVRLWYGEMFEPNAAAPVLAPAAEPLALEAGGQVKPTSDSELSLPAGPVGTPAWDLLATHPTGAHPPIVYFVRVGRQVKIGTSRSLERRLMDLALDREDLALALHGGRMLEAELHERFKPFRLGRSEWFAEESELAAFIASFGGPPIGDNALTSGFVAGDELAPDELATPEEPDPVDGDRIPAPTGGRTGAPETPGDNANDSGGAAAKFLAAGTGAHRRSGASANDSANDRKRTRRSMAEWVEVATPIFHAEFRRLRKQPTGDEFAAAIAAADLGPVSASTAKNIRTAILDATDIATD